MRFSPLGSAGCATLCAWALAWAAIPALAQPSGQANAPTPPSAAPQSPAHAHPEKSSAKSSGALQTPKPAHETGHPPASGKTADHAGQKPAAHAGKPQAHPKTNAAAPVPAPATPAPAPAPEAQAPPELPKGSATGLPLPRFAALRSDEVNMRAGPGTRYPIVWVYKRRDLPVQIEREFEVWRLVRDPEGVKGWVHQATLTGRRTFVVIDSARTLRREADDQSPAAAELKPGVIGRIRTCEAASAWCQVQVGEYRGYLKRTEIWAVQAGEAITN